MKDNSAKVMVKKKKKMLLGFLAGVQLHSKQQLSFFSRIFFFFGPLSHPVFVIVSSLIKRLLL